MVLSLTGFVALLSTGLLAGILLGHRTGTSFALPNIPDSSFIKFQQIVHLNYVKFMPALQIISILASVTGVYLLRQAPLGMTFVLMALAAAGTIAVFAITLTVNVPVNKILMTWNASTPPANARELWRPWDKGNTVRTIIALASFVLQLAAITSRLSASS